MKMPTTKAQIFKRDGTRETVDVAVKVEHKRGKFNQFGVSCQIVRATKTTTNGK